MRFDLNEDQATFATVLDQILAAPEAEFAPQEGWARFDHGAALDAALDQNGFFDAAGEGALGAVMGAEMIARIAARPVAIECAASALLRALLAPDLPRPVAVLEGANPGATRFACEAKSIIWITESAVCAAPLPEGAARPVESLFAFPMGEIDTGALDWSPLAASADEARQLWRVALGAEIVGAMRGGLEAVLDHVRQREQFARPLGGFQAVQHRLAEVAVRLEAGHLMVLRAAQSGAAGDAALALAHLQNAAQKTTYDLHQFMGAMGLTLEHPLHRWTYRIRLLRSMLGGAPRQFEAYADARWGNV